MIEAELPDGTVLEFPEGTSQDVIQRVVKQRIGVAQQPAAAPAKPQERSQLAALGGSIGQGVGNVALGAQNLLGMGLEKLGAEQAGKWLQQDAASGKKNLQSEIDPYEQQYPTTVAGGRLAGEVAATLPVGGVLGKALGAVAPSATGLATALRTGGAVGPNLATRVAGGALTGAASSALINPEEAGTGAMIGGSLPVAGKALSMAGPAAKRILGATTGVGDEAISQAYQAGKTGGAQGKAFADALRGQSNMDDVLTAAKQNLQALGAQKQQAYRSGMANIKADQTVLSFDGINDAVKNAANMASFKGQAKNPQAAEAVSKVANTVDEWMRLNPAEYHTPEGLDALKHRVGAVLESIPFEQKTARTAVGDIYNSIKSEISKQAPEYSRVMRDYSEASELIGEIERSLSLGKKAAADTSMRKLQSLMRNNVNTSYGYRDQLARQLEQAGGQQLMPALAGQAMSEWTPRGIQRATSAATGGGLALTGNIPAAAGMAALSSPRLVGEGAYLAGQAANTINPALLEALRRGTYSSAPVIGAQ